jgi:hypothetical protein
MTFTPKTEEQLSERSLWPEGSYDFRVAEATECKSKAGRDQIKLKLILFKGEATRFVYDYLQEALEYKLRHFCEATGLLVQYDSGRLNADDMVGREGIASIKIEPAKDGFEAKNAVKDYVVKKKDIRRPDTKTASLPLADGGSAVDDVPF